MDCVARLAAAEARVVELEADVERYRDECGWDLFDMTVAATQDAAVPALRYRAELAEARLAAVVVAVGALNAMVTDCVLGDVPPAIAH